MLKFFSSSPPNFLNLLIPPNKIFIFKKFPSLLSFFLSLAHTHSLSSLSLALALSLSLTNALPLALSSLSLPHALGNTGNQLVTQNISLFPTVPQVAFYYPHRQN